MKDMTLSRQFRALRKLPLQCVPSITAFLPPAITGVIRFSREGAMYEDDTIDRRGNGRHAGILSRAHDDDVRAHSDN